VERGGTGKMRGGGLRRRGRRVRGAEEEEWRGESGRGGGQVGKREGEEAGTGAE